MDMSQAQVQTQHQGQLQGQLRVWPQEEEGEGAQMQMRARGRARVETAREWGREDTERYHDALTKAHRTATVELGDKSSEQQQKVSEKGGWLDVASWAREKGTEKSFGELHPRPPRDGRPRESLGERAWRMRDQSQSQNRTIRPGQGQAQIGRQERGQEAQRPLWEDLVS